MREIFLRAYLRETFWIQAAVTNSLSEDKFESSWPCSIHKYCRVQICIAYSGKSGQKNHEEMRKDGPAQERPVRAPQTECNDHKRSTCWKAPSIGPERGENSVRKPGERYKHPDEEKSGKGDPGLELIIIILWTFVRPDPGRKCQSFWSSSVYEHDFLPPYICV